MKQLEQLVLVAAMVFVGGCGARAAEGPLSASCKPAVEVSSVGPKGRPASSAQTRQAEVAQVYWDVSRSMRDFAATAERKNGERWTDDLSPVVDALDSSILLSAHAQQIEHYGVGESIKPMSTARAALQPTAKRTALHLVAEQIGTALASGTAQAALVVSDLELDAPPRTAAGGGTVCGGLPLPGTSEAGALFGRCFENAITAAGGAPLTRTNLLVHVFRKSTHGRELFILLFATDREFGGQISAEIAQRLDFSPHVIFDSGAVAASNVACTLTAPSPAVHLRPVKGCVAKCFDADAAIRAECGIRRPANDAWIYSAGKGVGGAAHELLKKKTGDHVEQAVLRFAIPCNTPPGRFDANVSFTWRERTPWSQDRDAAFAQKASVRDLFDSLNDAIARTAAPLTLRVGIGLAK